MMLSPRTKSIFICLVIRSGVPIPSTNVSSSPSGMIVLTSTTSPKTKFMCWSKAYSNKTKR